MGNVMMVTDRGKPTEIVWSQEAQATQVLPMNVPRVNSPNRFIGPLQPLPPVAGVPGDLPGKYQAEWFLTPTDGLAVQNVRYVQSPTESHNIVESMQWNHLRLIVDRGPAPVQVIPVPLPDSKCVEAVLITQPGTRTNDGKVFAFAASASFQPFRIPDPLAPRVSYTLTITQSYLFGAPARDIEPSASVVAVKVAPLMTVAVETSDPNFPPPSVAADLKLVFSPRLTRPDQHRPLPQFPNSSRRDTNVVSMFCDTNIAARGTPGAGFPPTDPNWDVVFDYGEPDLGKEIEFDAVVFPRSAASSNPYKLIGPIGAKKTLLCQRVGGQGEFDNIHIHPWVGLDDPTGAGKADPASAALVEAPLAADEVIHMHWRWGTFIPDAAKDDENLARSFRGYDVSGIANVLSGAPLIPPSLSLRVKIADPNHDVSDPTKGLLDPRATAVWYSPIYHNPLNHGYTQFCGHGFAFAYRLKDLVKGLSVTNANLLDDPSVVFSYHSVRWASAGQQRIPTASRVAGLQRNRLGTGSPPVDQSSFTFG
jgi:hypothetical protein